MARNYESPFDLKTEMKKIKAEAKDISDAKAQREFLAREQDACKKHSDMLRKMSSFVNQKNKNGDYKK